VLRLKNEVAMLKERDKNVSMDGLRLELENQKNRAVAAKRSVEALQTQV
jgi:hypothetical protein